MKVLRGSANVVRQVSSSSSSWFTVLLEIDGRPVTLSLPEVIVISDGDYVSVAGCEKRGLFHAVAYINVSRAVVGKSQVILPLLLGVILCATVFLSPAGFWALHMASRNHRAFKMVMDEKPGDIGAVPAETVRSK